ncbi:MAG: SDR family NAD(P)-dependent oxidoreductase, partial [Alphaproteobacteria bacterium]|nr:SDR family NAD(P)-dependent oxidoreductase [Alphaproteobacteria bacterium]
MSNASAGTATPGFAHYPSLKGEAVIVTGGATGIGASIVEHFAAQGARVGFLDVDEAAGRALAAATGTSFIRCDLRD